MVSLSQWISRKLQHDRVLARSVLFQEWGIITRMKKLFDEDGHWLPAHSDMSEALCSWRLSESRMNEEWLLVDLYMAYASDDHWLRISDHKGLLKARARVESLRQRHNALRDEHINWLAKRPLIAAA